MPPGRFSSEQNTPDEGLRSSSLQNNGLTGRRAIPIIMIFFHGSKVWLGGSCLGHTNYNEYFAPALNLYGTEN